MSTAKKHAEQGIEGLAPPQVGRVVVDGEILHIAPASVSSLGAMLRDGRSVFEDLGNGVSLTELFSDHTEALIDICAHGSSLTRDEVANLKGDSFIDLLGAVIEANADFFVRRLRPAMDRLMERITATIQPEDLPDASSD